MSSSGRAARGERCGEAAVIGASYAFDTARLKLGGVAVEGTIINVEVKQSTDSDDNPVTLYTPTVQFRTAGGQHVLLVSYENITTSPSMVRGQMVPVRYLAADVQTARIDSWWTNWSRRWLRVGRVCISHVEHPHDAIIEMDRLQAICLPVSHFSTGVI